MGALSNVSPTVVDMMRRCVEVHVSSCNERLVPSLMRAMAIRVDQAADSVTVYLAKRQADQLLHDIHNCGQLAVIVCEPITWRSVQIKASSVTMRVASETDRAVLEDYRVALEREIARVRGPVPVVRAILAYQLSDIVLVEFEPDEIFEQSPGANAGKLMAIRQ